MYQFKGHCKGTARDSPQTIEAMTTTLSCSNTFWPALGESGVAKKFGTKNCKT